MGFQKNYRKKLLEFNDIDPAECTSFCATQAADSVEINEAESDAELRERFNWSSVQGYSTWCNWTCVLIINTGDNKEPGIYVDIVSGEPFIFHL